MSRKTYSSNTKTETYAFLVAIFAIASLATGLLNTIFVFQNIGWATLIPWEYYKGSFEMGNLLIISQAFAALMSFYAYKARQPFTGLYSPIDGLVFLLVIVFSIAALSLYWSWPFFMFMVAQMGFFTIYNIWKAV
jgi:hypothetical protein